MYLELVVPSLLQIAIISIVALWITINLLFFRKMYRKEKNVLNELYSHDEIKTSLTLFLIRFIVTVLILLHLQFFPRFPLPILGIDMEINSGLITLGAVWLPEILAIIQWGIIFAVFALAGLGASLLIDHLYFPDHCYIWGFGPLSIIMVILIVLSFRYFSNYSVREIINMAKKVRLLRKILLFACVSFILIGGGVFWGLFISSKVYRNTISSILDKIETTTAAVSVIIILLTLPLQFPKNPLPIQILILLNAPVAFAAVAILLVKNKFRAWKDVFEVYTEEFAAQSLIIKDKIRAKNKKFLIIALIGNWAAVPVALYNIGCVIYWVISDILLVILAVLGVGVRYISSMISATKEILGEIKQT